MEQFATNSGFLPRRGRSRNTAGSQLSGRQGRRIWVPAWFSRQSHGKCILTRATCISSFSLFSLIIHSHVLAFRHACFSAVRAKNSSKFSAMLFFDNHAFDCHFGNVRISAAGTLVLVTQNETERFRIAYVKSLLIFWARSVFYVPSYCYVNVAIPGSEAWQSQNVRISPAGTQ